MMTTATFRECDFHTHTELCGEGQAKGFTLRKLFETADELGLRYVGYSEHWHKATPRDLFLRIRDEVETLQPQFRVKVWVSAEIDVLNSRGDLACDPDDAAGILDYVSVAISHYGHGDIKPLQPDLVEDTVEMIRAVCRIPAVTMLMHPQIVYGQCMKSIDQVVTPDVYDEVMREIVTHNKVVDYASVQMSMDYLHDLKFGPDKLAIAEQSFDNYSAALVRNRVRLAPGTDAHHVFYHDTDRRWFGNNDASYRLLTSHGYTDAQLWYGQGVRSPQKA
ncbi:MAG: hypothetical protein V2A73_20795 [Pseudomonadota bacterium]